MGRILQFKKPKNNKNPFPALTGLFKKYLENAKLICLILILLSALVLFVGSMIVGSYIHRD